MAGKRIIRPQRVQNTFQNVYGMHINASVKDYIDYENKQATPQPQTLKKIPYSALY
jgi:hypothetical protein